MAGGVAGSSGLGDPGLLGLAVRNARSLRAFSIWHRSEGRGQKPPLAQSQGRPFTPHLHGPPAQEAVSTPSSLQYIRGLCWAP